MQNLEKGSSLFGQATTKSSVGRMDVLTRLIVDGMDRYDYFCQEKLQPTSKMYLEITPITFNVKVKEGISLSQLRFFLGKPEYSEIEPAVELYKPLLLNPDEENYDGTLSVDISPTRSDQLIHGYSVSAYCSKDIESKNRPTFALWKLRKKPNPCDYWKFVEAEIDDNGNYRIKIEKDNFYIIRSKEKIALPESVAVYCRAMDETFGEMRIHYAGFVHPYFGYDKKNNPI